MTVTIDTCVWISLKVERIKPIIYQILKCCAKKAVNIYVSNRFENYDSVEMDTITKKLIRETMKEYSVQKESAPFRLGSVNNSFGSRFGDRDFLVSIKETEKEEKFVSVFGLEPMKLSTKQTGKKISNWIGDYDALKQHYLKGRDLFITLDTKIYFSDEKRLIAKNKLNLIILDPVMALKELNKYVQ